MMKLYHRYTFAISICLAAASVCPGQPTYTATAIPSPGTANFNRLQWISDDGKLGFGETAFLSADGSRMQPCVQYKDGTFSNLPTPNFSCTVVRGNNSGAFTGTLIGAGPTFQAYLYQDGTFTVLVPQAPGQLGISFATGMNERGDVSGYAIQPTGNTAVIPDGKGTVVQLSKQFAFVYSGGQLRKLDDQNMIPSAQSAGINNDGDVTGSLGLRATVWQHGGGIVDLGVLPGDFNSIGMAINSKGQVAGLSHPLEQNVGPTPNFDPTFPYHPFLYDNGTMIAIPVPGVVGSSVVLMNEGGEVIVSSYDSSVGPVSDQRSMRPFYYANGQAFDLNTLVTNLPDGTKLNVPMAINNSGQILVISLSDENPVQYLLTPGTSENPAPADSHRVTDTPSSGPHQSRPR